MLARPSSVHLRTCRPRAPTRPAPATSAHSQATAKQTRKHAVQHVQAWGAVTHPPESPTASSSTTACHGLPHIHDDAWPVRKVGQASRPQGGEPSLPDQAGPQGWHSMQFHAIPCNSMRFHAIPCNSMQFHCGPGTLPAFLLRVCPLLTPPTNTRTHAPVPGRPALPAPPPPPRTPTGAPRWAWAAACRSDAPWSHEGTHSRAPMRTRRAARTGQGMCGACTARAQRAQHAQQGWPQGAGGHLPTS